MMHAATLTVGEVASLLGVPRKRVQWWIARRFLLVEPWVYGKGRYFRVPRSELEVAERAVDFARHWGIRTSRTLFGQMRTAEGITAVEAIRRLEAAYGDSA